MSLRIGKKQNEVKRSKASGVFVFGITIMMSFFLFANSKAALAIDGIMNGKTISGETDNFLLWLQTYDPTTSPYFFDKFFIDKAGNVGIGTTNPDARRLHISGLDGDMTGTGGLRIDTKQGVLGTRQTIFDIGPYTTGANGAVMKLFENGIETVRLISGSGAGNNYINSGNVGIGTTAPNDTLSIGNSGAAPAGSAKTGHNFTSTYLATDSYALVNYGLVQTLILNATSSIIAGNLWNGTLNGNIYNGTAGAGNVGIGTTNPIGLLQIQNGGTNTNIQSATANFVGAPYGNGVIGIFDTSALAVGTGGGINFGGYYTGTTHTEFAAIRGSKETVTDGQYGGALRMFTRISGGAMTEKLRITNDGNVGIGTTAPNDVFSIGNSGTAPAGSSKTGHNYTMTYLATDDYALANYGLVRTITVNASNTAAVISGGDLNMGGHNILNVNKLTVNTIDPLYDIKGIKYSTYAGSISGGVKEEVVGKVIINSRSISDNKEYEKVIDFAKETEGSNLWVWRQVIDFTPDNIEVFMTPFGKFANTYYSVEDNKLIFHSDRPVTISYRLIGSRFDWRKWPTRAINQMEQGMKVE